MDAAFEGCGHVVPPQSQRWCIHLKTTVTGHQETQQNSSTIAEERTGCNAWGLKNLNPHALRPSSPKVQKGCRVLSSPVLLRI